MTVAVFDYQAWVTRFPEFADSVSEDQANALFLEATAYHSNDGTGPITDPNTQLAALNLLVAHLAAKNYGVNGEGPSPMVGQVTSASQGSASVSVNPLAAPGTQAWYMTTRYGSDYWFMTRQTRTMRYRLAPQRSFEPGLGFPRRGYPLW